MPLFIICYLLFIYIINISFYFNHLTLASGPCSWSRWETDFSFLPKYGDFFNVFLYFFSCHVVTVRGCWAWEGIPILLLNPILLIKLLLLLLNSHIIKLLNGTFILSKLFFLLLWQQPKWEDWNSNLIPGFFKLKTVRIHLQTVG